MTGSSRAKVHHTMTMMLVIDVVIAVAAIALIGHPAGVLLTFTAVYAIAAVMLLTSRRRERT